MGSRIAGHLANANIPVVLLDIRTDLVQRAVGALSKAKPAALFEPEVLDLIRIGNFQEDLREISSCDWVIEAVTEDLMIKQGLIQAAASSAPPDAVFTTNTSGLSVAAIAESLSIEFRRRWFGVHFFNPPRQMRLVEMIPTVDSDPGLFAGMRQFLTERLGKTVVVAKDTPNFVANRIGLFALLNNVRLMQELNLNVHDVDLLTGSAIGWPNTGTFRLMDLIGIDVLAKMQANFKSRGGDERSDVRFPQFMTAMIERGWLGDKTGQGFYRKGPEWGVLDWRTLEYQPLQRPDLGFLEGARKIRRIPERLQALIRSTEPQAAFYKQMLPELWEYAARRVPEICDAPAEVDTAMKAGFNWELGPFEMQTGAAAKPDRKPIRANGSGSLFDLGDGIACLEFQTKMNAIDDGVLSFVEETLSNPTFAAYLIGSRDAAHFSAGANLTTILGLIEQKAWSALEDFIAAFQKMTQAVKFCPRPVVAAPFGLCLGGGAEVVLHSAYRQAHAELSMGLVEISVGLIPGGGGCKEMALRAIDGEATWSEAFRALVTGRRSQSAPEARRMRLLRPGDGLTMNRDLLLPDALKMARALVADYQPPVPRGGLAGGSRSDIEAEIEVRRRDGSFTEYDAQIAGRIADILAAGNSEQHMLDLERETFVELCASTKTPERIAAMLRTGTPLRN